ncbi:unnamed protein product [Leptidea sinapis]|uniref:Uncharacterized protein n=1 Tax=Leptidea sinapis TaxID=189913 RepID=A0A5E4PTN6_9NEOP|nr:unnamed protein product [Leptidea sinapis]
MCPRHKHCYSNYSCFGYCHKPTCILGYCSTCLRHTRVFRYFNQLISFGYRRYQPQQRVKFWIWFKRRCWFNVPYRTKQCEFSEKRKYINKFHQIFWLGCGGCRCILSYEMLQRRLHLYF